MLKFAQARRTCPVTQQETCASRVRNVNSQKPLLSSPSTQVLNIVVTLSLSKVRMTLIDKLKWRYAAKKMNPGQVVPQDKVDRIVEAIRLTATSSGLQPYEVWVVTNPEIRQKIQAVANNQAQVTEGSHLLVFAAWDDYTPERIQACIEERLAARKARDFKRSDTIRDELKAAGIVDKGMIPKVDSAVAAIKSGVEKVSFVDGRTPHSVMLEIFTDKGVGTEVVL